MFARFGRFGAIAVVATIVHLWGATRMEALSALNAPADYHPVWQDEFEALSLRKDGSGVWESFGGNDTTSRGQPGFGYDFFANPLWPGWPASVADLRVLTPEGLRLRARQPTPEEAALMPIVRGSRPWISSFLGTFGGVNFKPPFYVEFKARMPAGAKGWAPWAALWLYANARQRPPFPLKGQHYEIDVHEGFGNSDWIASNLHWDAGENTELQAKTFVNRAAGVDLSTGFHIFGCLVTATQVIGYFDGAETGRAFVPAGASSAQPLALMLDVSAGLPWSQDLPAGGPYDMTVRYVRVFAPDSTGIVLGANSQ